MELPIRIVDGPLAERVVSVDGAWPQPGLNLSHWPGNTTPAELRHDLSTGSALAFARLPAARRAELAQGCVAIANNHYDTDGVCAIFAVRHPDAALAREQALLDAAAAGDLFRFPNERAFAIDAIVGHAADPARSPWGAALRPLSGSARHERAVHELVRVLPELLDGALAPYAALWEPELAACRADQADLAAAQLDDLVHLDFAIWTAAPGRTSSRTLASGSARSFDPGRHALFGTTQADRVLAIGPASAPGRGATYRFAINTTSWFDLVTRRAQPRPNLAALAVRLNELEGTAVHDELAWRAQPVDSPSPELWFGQRQHPFFAEHCAALAPSRLPPVDVRAEVLDALRASWTFPDES